ncbi:hypothetical protein CJU89_6560 [Yarrowia sp. B02]|nr:hypothetical protein CJU89_6560 [Yarrowia sp. B02]
MLKLQPFRDTSNKSNQHASVDEVTHITRKVAALNINNTADKENRLPEGKSFVSNSSAFCPASPASPATPKRKPLGLIDSPGPKPKDYVYYTSELAPHRKPIGSAANQANVSRRLMANDPAKRKLVLMR